MCGGGTPADSDWSFGEMIVPVRGERETVYGQDQGWIEEKERKDLVTSLLMQVTIFLLEVEPSKAEAEALSWVQS